MSRSVGANVAGSTLAWLAVSLLGWFSLLVASALLFMPAGSGLPGVITASVAGAFGGLIMALGRWFIVRRWLRQTAFGAWLGAGASGFALSLIVVYLLGGTGANAPAGLGLAAIWAAGGLIAGLAQALAMGGVRGSAWWAIANAVSWAVLITLSRSAGLGDGGALAGILAEGLLSWVALLGLLGASNGRT